MKSKNSRDVSKQIFFYVTRIAPSSTDSDCVFYLGLEVSAGSAENFGSL